jgi:hypothetical protein
MDRRGRLFYRLLGCWSRFLNSFKGFGDFDQPAGLVEFKRELDLGIIERGEGSVNFIATVLLQLVAGCIAGFAEELDEDTFAALGDQGTGPGRRGDAADPGELGPLQLGKKVLDCLAFLDLAERTPR